MQTNPILPTVGAYVLLTVCICLFAGFIYGDWVDKVRPLNDTTTADIDPTKYYIQSSSRRTQSADFVNHDNKQNSASFPTRNCSRLDEQATVRLQRIADSTPNVAVPYHSLACGRGSSSHVEVWQSDRCGCVVESRRAMHATETNIAVSDLNLTNSMTSLIESGSTSAHAWPSMSTSVTNLAQAGARKPLLGNHRGRAAKWRNQRLQSNDRENPSDFYNGPLRRPMSVDVVFRPDTTPLDGPEPSDNSNLNSLHSVSSSFVFSPPTPNDFYNRPLRRLVSVDAVSRPDTMSLNGPAPSDNSNRLNLASSFVFSPPGGVDSTTPIRPRPLTNPRLQRPVSTSVLPRPLKVFHDTPTTSMHGNHGPRSSCQPDGAEMTVNDGNLSVTSSAERKQKLVTQERRGDVSCTEFIFTGSTNGSQDCQQHMIVKHHRRSKPRPDVHLIGEKRKGIQPQKTVSLLDVTSVSRISNSGAAKSRFPVGAVGSVWYPRDLTSKAGTAVGVASSHESLSDEGYHTKDSGSTLSLNLPPYGVRRGSPLFSAYL